MGVFRNFPRQKVVNKPSLANIIKSAKSPEFDTNAPPKNPVATRPRCYAFFTSITALRNQLNA